MKISLSGDLQVHLYLNPNERLDLTSLEVTGSETQSISQPQISEQGTDNEKPRAGRPKEMDAKITSLYFEERLDTALRRHIMQRELETGERTNKSEWIRNLVENELRRLRALED